MTFVMAARLLMLYKRSMGTKTQHNASRLRFAVQLGVTLLLVFLGYRLYGFTMHYMTHGAAPFVEHPEGVEGFLPIGALTSLKFFLLNLHVHPAHPAALVMFVGAIAVSVGLKKGFCGWICPVGFISERLYRPMKKLFGKNPRMPRRLDYVLRSLKYILLLYFFKEIMLWMPPEYVEKFLNSDYWMVADVKMLFFFLDISGFTLLIILFLVFMSMVFRMFWCRYLCPYGAFLGIFGLVSPFEITRDEDKCIDCGKCSANCPYHLPVDKVKRVTSPECTSCMTCLSNCPADAIEYTDYNRKRRISPRKYAALIVGIFFGLILVAKVAGYWDSGVSDADLKRVVPIAESIRHP